MAPSATLMKSTVVVQSPFMTPQASSSRTLTLTGQTYFLGEDLSVNYSAVIPTPEPASFAVLGVGLIGLLALRQRSRGKLLAFRR